MTHTAPYGISAETYNDLKAIRAANIVDTCIVMHGGGAAPPTQFPIDAKAAGTSVLANNGNDGVGGWDGTAQYYQRMASLGYVGCGGESEQQAEIDSLMQNLIFIDMGGEGTPGGYQDDIWRVTHPGPVSGHGAACRFETYDSNSNFWGWNVIGQAVKDAASHGVKEIGILIGNWMLYHAALKECQASGEPIEKAYADKIKALKAVDEYIQLGKDIEANGYTFAGMWVWAGYGSNMNSLYQQFAPWYQAFMAVWPADMRTMDVRYGTAPTPAHIPHIWCGLVGQATLYTGTQPVGASVGTYGQQGWLDTNTKNWVPAANLTAAEKAALIVPVTLLQGGAAIKTVTPDANGGFSATVTSSNAGALHYNWKGNTGDTGPDMTVTWTAIPAITFASSPAECSRDSNSVDVFVIGSDKACWHNHRIGTSWAGWDSIEGLCTSAPAVVARGEIIDVFVRGSDAGLWNRQYDGTKWTAWRGLGGVILAGTAPAVTSKDANSLDVFVIGTSNALYRKSLSGTTWSAWTDEGNKIQ